MKITAAAMERPTVRPLDRSVRRHPFERVDRTTDDSDAESAIEPIPDDVKSFPGLKHPRCENPR